MTAEIISARLVLRKVDEHDAVDLLRLRTSARVFEFLDPDPTPLTLEGTIRTIELWNGSGSGNAAYGYWRVGDRSGRFIGVLFLLPGATCYPRFGGFSLPQTWGGGYALESSAALLEFAFAIVRVTGVIAYTHRDNRSARSSLELCGFESQALASLEKTPTVAYFLSLKRWIPQRTRLIQAKNATDPRALLRQQHPVRRRLREMPTDAARTGDGTTY